MARWRDRGTVASALHVVFLMAVGALRVAVLMVVALLRLRESAQLHVRIAASELLMVWMVALASLNLVMAAVVLMAVAVSMTLLKLQDTTQLNVRTVARLCILCGRGYWRCAW